MDAETVQAIVEELEVQKQQKEDLAKVVVACEADIARMKEELNATKEDARISKETAFRIMAENGALRANQSICTEKELGVMKRAVDLIPRMVKLVLKNQGVDASDDPITGKDIEDFEHFIEVVRHALDDSGV